MKKQKQNNNSNSVEVNNKPEQIRVRTRIESSDVFIYGTVLFEHDDSYVVRADGRDSSEIWLKSICEIV